MPRSTRTHAAHTLDVMSITVILVVAIFAGVIGFYLGQAMGANQMLQEVQQMVR